MIIIRFADADAERRGLGYLAGRFTLREDGVERKLPLFESDEVTRVLGGTA